jgi:hypothetical protein
MSLGYSLENIYSWKSQYERIKRWERRLITYASDNEHDPLDFYIAFFQSCYHMRDWLIKSGAMERDRIDELISSNTNMRLCRDICNRSKHLTLDRPASVDPRFSIVVEYRGRSAPMALVIVADYQKFELAGVVAGCVAFWEALVRDHDLVAPEKPRPTP